MVSMQRMGVSVMMSPTQARRDAHAHHASRITHHASRITHHASRITHHASRPAAPIGFDPLRDGSFATFSGTRHCRQSF